MNTLLFTAAALWHFEQIILQTHAFSPPLPIRPVMRGIHPTTFEADLHGIDDSSSLVIIFVPFKWFLHVVMLSES